MSHDRSTVEAVVKNYFDGLYEGDADERLERSTGGAPAIRAMAIQGVAEFVSHGVADRAAKAFSGKNTSIRFC